MTEHPSPRGTVCRGAARARVDALLDAEAVFVSPVAHTSAWQEARDDGTFPHAAFQVFFNPTAFRYVREIVGATDAMLESFETEIDGVSVNGVDIIKWNDAGKIVEFKDDPPAQGDPARSSAHGGYAPGQSVRCCFRGTGLAMLERLRTTTRARPAVHATPATACCCSS